ncbi:MAG: antibiotic biosynthesis monooxygenase [Pseudomonadota bacterium]
MKQTASKQEAVAALITHSVSPENHGAYEDWLGEISTVAKTFPGHVKADYFRPIADSHEPYQVVLTFETSEQLTNWLISDERDALIQKAEALIEHETRTQYRGELQQLVGPAAPAAAPKYKMVLLTWLGVTILTSLSGIVLEPFLGVLPYLASRALVAGIVVILLAYGLLPLLTKLFRRWLT